MVTLLFKLHVTIISLNKDEQDLFFLEHVLSLLGDIFSPKSLLKMITNKFPSSLSKRCLTDYSTKKCNNPLVMKTLTYVYQHIHESISLEIIAEAIQVSAEHLSRVFKAEMDIGFNSYINQLKIEHAKTYIRIKNMEIQEVADVLGYSSPRYFNKVFKKVTGLTVKEFCQQKPL
ncbi:MAG: AraC family transcriptional regulator [Spirochaetia bacterium]|nr:AraC family transcriptional regulator [Spirochaetia bacterium]